MPRCKLLSLVAAILGAASMVVPTVVAQSAAPVSSSSAAPSPRFVSQNGRHMLLVDGRPFLVLGAQMHNSSNWPATLPSVWRAYEAMGANTLEAPVYWEQMEPRPGVFDFSSVDRLLAQARAHKARLTLLWFGTWKNASGHYWPEWMKLDEAKYPHLLGPDGKRLDSPSPFAPATLAADIQAFSALCAHLKTADPQHTVILLQVENEAGTWGSARDHSPAADKLFAQPVPDVVLRAKGMSAMAGKDWRTVFGEDAEEYFHAWAVAHYIEQVAAAGKKILPAPMFVNAALRDPFHPGHPPAYESGGPSDNVIDIYKAVAPSIDVIAPDIYLPESAKYLKTLENYGRADNPLLIPETGNRAEYSRYFFSALGAQAVGWAPFGMDYTGDSNAPLGADVDQSLIDGFALNYRLVGPVAGRIAQWSFEGRVHGWSEEREKHFQEATVGDWKLKISYGLTSFGFSTNPPGNKEPVGRALVIELGSDEFLVLGASARVEFTPRDANRHTMILKLEAGHWENGSFAADRVLNGDQSDWGLNFGPGGGVMRLRLATY